MLLYDKHHQKNTPEKPPFQKKQIDSKEQDLMGLFYVLKRKQENTFYEGNEGMLREHPQRGNEDGEKESHRE